jgi:hypothetical protein
MANAHDTSHADHDAPDAWHDHSHDAAAQPAHTEQVAVGQVMTIGLVLFMAIVASVVAVYGFYKWYTSTALATMEVTTPGAPALVWRAEKDAQLKLVDAGGTKTIKGGEGVPDRSITIRPLAEAMNSTIEQYRKVPGVVSAGENTTEAKKN